MSWIRGTSTGHINLSNDVLAAILGTSADSVDSVVNGGSSGYVVGDLVTLTGGTFTVATVLEVTAVSAGVITAARIYNAGVYSVAPGDPVSQGSTSGAGVGTPTFNMTYSSNGWTQDRDTTWTGSQREVIIHGSGGGSDAIYVGWRTFEDVGSTRYNWELHGMTGYDSGLDINQQVGINPGDHTSGTTAIQAGAYLPLLSTSMDWYLSVTPYRIILSVKAGSGYYQAYLGFINRFATSTEYPYPLCVAGSTDTYSHTPATSQKMSGLTDPWTDGAIDAGPLHLLDAGGTWVRFANATISGTTLNNASAVNITVPCGKNSDSSAAGTPLQDRWTPVTAALNWNNLIVQNSSLGASSGNLEPTPGTGNDYYVLFPTMLVRSADNGQTQQVYGELDDVFWLSVFGGVTSEDRIIQTDVYRVFLNCNRAGQNYEFLAIKET
jgi:hypothetical protein